MLLPWLHGTVCQRASKVKDRSDSFARRQLVVEFTKCFTGKTRDYIIRNDYMKRQDVLKYVLHRVLHSNYYKLSEPSADKVMMEEYKTENDPICQFLDDILPEASWDCLPFAFLYDLYKAWMTKKQPSGAVIGRNTMIREIKKVKDSYPEWEVHSGAEKFHAYAGTRCPEPLIRKYRLLDWINPAPMTDTRLN